MLMSLVVMKVLSYFVFVPVRLFLVILSGLDVVVTDGCVTAYRGLVGEYDIAVRIPVVIEER
jgi:hypothetical protein